MQLSQKLELLPYFLISSSLVLTLGFFFGNWPFWGHLSLYFVNQKNRSPLKWKANELHLKISNRFIRYCKITCDSLRLWEHTLPLGTLFQCSNKHMLIISINTYLIQQYHSIILKYSKSIISLNSKIVIQCSISLILLNWIWDQNQT